MPRESTSPNLKYFSIEFGTDGIKETTEHIAINITLSNPKSVKFVPKLKMYY